MTLIKMSNTLNSNLILNILKKILLIGTVSQGLTFSFNAV